MTVDDWYTAVLPKVHASWNLHMAVEKDLDFFVLLSSTSGIVGNRGQSNYSAGNTYQDAITRYRISQGLKATVLDLGMVLSVGFVAENAKLISHLCEEGFTAIREEEFHAVLDQCCDPVNKAPPLLKSQVILGLEIPESEILYSKGVDAPLWQRDPLFSHLFQVRTSSERSYRAGKAVNYTTLLTSADSIDSAENFILDAILTKLSKALSIEAKDIDPSKPLYEFSVDSLVAVELRTWLLKEIGAEVAVFDMMGGSNIRQLASLVTIRSSFVKSP